MKKIVWILSVFISVSALAFGGFGGGGRTGPGRVATTYKGGVDAIGVHFGGDEEPCPEHSTDIQGLCFCDEGYTPDKKGGCVADMCLEYEPTDCLPDCDPITGEPVAGDDGKYCENKTGRCSLGICLPIVCANCKDLVDGECVERTCGDGEVCNVAQDACLCDTENKYYGEAGNCQLCNGTGSIFKDASCQCNNENDYYGEANNCNLCSGANREIKNNDCVCINGYEEYNNECVEKCTDGYQRNQQTGECELICSTNSECSGLGTCMGCVIPDGADSGTCQYACEEVEYLESTGTQYINTDWIRTKAKTKISVRFMSLINQSTGRTLFGSSDYSLRTPYLGWEGSLGNNYMTLWGSGGAWKNDIPAQIGQIHDWMCETNNTTKKIFAQIDDTVVFDYVAYPKGNSTLTGLSETLFNVAIPEDVVEYCSARIYSFKGWEDDILVRDFVPVLDPNGTPAMLDRVENKLYYNAGTGQFKTNKDEN